MARLLPALLVVLALVFPGVSAHADAHELRYRTKVDVPVTVGLGSAWLLSELLKPQLVREHAAWTRENEADRSIADALVWDHRARAAHTSDALGLALLPVGAIVTVVALGAREGGAAGSRHARENAVIVTEAVVTAAVVNQVVKLAAGRRRPYAQTPGNERVFGADSDMSFYSGHASIAFSLVSAAGTTAWLRGYRAAPYVWGVGFPIAAFTAYLRIAADRHYFTDVLTGALAGTLIGALVPLLGHTRRPDLPQIGVAPGRSALLVTLSWTDVPFSRR